MLYPCENGRMARAESGSLVGVWWPESNVSSQCFSWFVYLSILDKLHIFKYFNWNIDLPYLKRAEITKIKMFIGEMRTAENELGAAL